MEAKRLIQLYLMFQDFGVPLWLNKNLTSKSMQEEKWVIRFLVCRSRSFFSDLFFLWGKVARAPCAPRSASESSYSRIEESTTTFQPRIDSIIDNV